MANPFLQLSARELAVCKHLLQGHNIKEIAYTMDLRPTTVATYKKRIFEKTGVETFIDLQHKAGLYNIV